MSEIRLPIHPYAELFPPMVHPEFDRLCGDIAVNGLQESIVLHEGKVLEGRNRYLACLARQVAPRFREYAGECGSPLAFVGWIWQDAMGRRPAAFFARRARRAHLAPFAHGVQLGEPADAALAG